MIEHVRNNSASETAHHQWCATVDSPDRLADNKSLSGVSKHKDDVGFDGKVGKRTVDDVSPLTPAANGTAYLKIPLNVF